MGRQAAGVTGIRLAKGDQVASMEVIEPEGYLVLVTTRGYGKRRLPGRIPGQRPRYRRGSDHQPKIAG